MSIDRKFIRNGNGCALCINATILNLLDINPEIDRARFNIENNKLIITKSNKKSDNKH